MSKQALFYYAENLHLVQKATFTTPAGKEYGLGENGRDLLVFLCNATNEKQGYVFHMGYQYIAEETGIHIATVKRLMAGLEQLRWITRTGDLIRHMGRGAPTVEYELTFYTASLTQKQRTGSPTGRPGATDNLAKSKPSKEAHTEIGLETEPEPEPQVTSDQGGQEWGQEHDLLLADCVATDLRLHPVKKDRGQIVPHLQKQYRPIVTRAIKEQPSTDLVGWCYQVRRGHTIAPATTGRKGKQLATNDLHSLFPGHQSLRQLSNADPTCKKCDGDGYFFHPDPIPGGYPNGEDFCPCIERNALRLVNE
jgi:hypothetical protein